MSSIDIDHGKDQKVAFASALVALAIVFVILFLFKISAKQHKEQVSVFVDIEIPLEMYKEPKAPDIFDSKTGGGASGSAADLQYAKNPPAQVERVATSSTGKESIASGKGQVTTGTDVNQVGTTSNVNKNPFGTGGSNGNTGTGAFGNDNGPGSGPGTGEGNRNVKLPARKMISKPNFSTINADESCSIYLKLIVAPDGSIKRVFNIAEKSTTKNSRIINEVIAMVQRSMRFDVRSHGEDETVFCDPISVFAQ